MLRNDVKITYIGGGSRGWARVFMGDIALQDNFCGEIRLYDIDCAAAETNKLIAEKMNRECSEVKSKWKYVVYNELDRAVVDADFVVISILPGTFDEMQSDVHSPESYGIYQSVGDTAGPGGVIRAMRCIPMFEVIARSVRDNAPDAYVINFTNPMTLCTRTLYQTFPAIKAFGCCHEVKQTKYFLARVVNEMTGSTDINHDDIKADVMGINHFTWFTKANCNGQDIYPIYRKYIDIHTGSYDFVGADSKDFLAGLHANAWKTSERVKMDLFLRYGQIAAAGDRHLAEFMNGSWYLEKPEEIARWGFGLTSVDWRKNDLNERLEHTRQLVVGEKPMEVLSSGEEFSQIINALLGGEDFVSNVNFPNRGQLAFAPKGAIVETNAHFSREGIIPIVSEPLNNDVEALVMRIILQQENLVRAVAKRDLEKAFNVFVSEPLCSRLPIKKSRELFTKMVQNTKGYLTDWNLNSCKL